MSELRRRARELGGQFQLQAHRTVYLVSNNPDLLEPGDILLSPETPAELLLRITCDYDHKTGALEVIQGSGNIELGGQNVRRRASLKDGDILHLGGNQYLRCNFSERLIEEERNLVREIEVADLSLQFPNGKRALDAVSFHARRGEIICVMGPSGCGKSTLLKTLSGHLKPSAGNIEIDGHDLYSHLEQYLAYLSFMPHEEAFDASLSVQENLSFAARIRAPHYRAEELKRRVDAKLIELGLMERASYLAGTPSQKILSSGERKRLNLGMDVIGRSDVYLLDEPTSGLSSKDSEHVVEIIKSLSHNKIVLATMHQPSARLLHLFHKCLLLDHGGRVAFFGTPKEILAYFHRAALEQKLIDSLPPAGDDPQESFEQPERIFDVLEYPLRDPAGEIIFVEDDSGHLSPARRFSPSFWQERFAAQRLTREVRQSQELKLTDNPKANSKQKSEEIPPHSQHNIRERWILWRTHFQRSFLARLRNRSNIAATLIQAPLLALLVSGALRYSESETYNFGEAFHIPTYLFLSLVVAMFLGLTNSADEIINERSLIERERNHSRRPFYYLSAKFLVLALFGLLQCLFYLLIGNWVIGIRGMLFEHLEWMFYSSLAGIGGGLLISSLVRDGKTAVNLVPLLLVPQIILGGALIRYEEINRSFHQLNDFAHWRPFDVSSEPSQLAVPLPCEFMPLRWTYEGTVITQAARNPLARAIAEVESAKDELVELNRNLRKQGKELTPEQDEHLSQLKQARASLLSLRAQSPEQIDAQLEAIKNQALDAQFDFKPNPKARKLPLSARDLYVNEKTLSLFDKAEMERLDVTRTVEPNVFFGASKIFELSAHKQSRWEFKFDELSKAHINALFQGEESWLVRIPTLWLNRAVALLFPLLTLVLTWWRIRYLLRKI